MVPSGVSHYSELSLDQRNEVTGERARVDPEARSAGGET